MRRGRRRLMGEKRSIEKLNRISRNYLEKENFYVACDCSFLNVR